MVSNTTQNAENSGRTSSYTRYTVRYVCYQNINLRARLVELPAEAKIHVLRLNGNAFTEFLDAAGALTKER